MNDTLDLIELGDVKEETKMKEGTGKSDGGITAPLTRTTAG